MKANQDLRDLMRIVNVPLWKVAKAYGVAESTFIKKLRIELDKEEKEHIIHLINTLKDKN